MMIESWTEALALFVVFAAGGLVIWRGIRREEMQRREWLRVHNPETYEDEFGELYDETGDPVG